MLQISISHELYAIHFQRHAELPCASNASNSRSRLSLSRVGNALNSSVQYPGWHINSVTPSGSDRRDRDKLRRSKISRQLKSRKIVCRQTAVTRQLSMDVVAKHLQTPAHGPLFQKERDRRSMGSRMAGEPNESRTPVTNARPHPAPEEPNACVCEYRDASVSILPPGSSST